MSATYPPSGLPVSDAPTDAPAGTAAPFESPFVGDLHGEAMDLFAVRVAHTPIGGARTIRRGIFDRLHLEVGMDGDGAPVSASRSQIGVAASDWGAPQQGDAIEVRIRGGEAVHIDQPPAPGDAVLAYVVVDPQVDGAGGILLVLGARAAAPGP